jgi:(p)ppGpp synthase/HD superfamily hydrolase
MSLILKAVRLAVSAHNGQFRKYSHRPYVEHPARVAARVAIHPDATEEMVAAAFLHDVLEDTPLNPEEITRETNTEVLAYVKWMTNRSKIDHPTANRAERKRIDRERLAGAPRRVKIIKMIDRLDNLREMDGSAGDFARLYGEESLLLVEVLKDADPALAEELRTVAESLRSRT